MRFLRVLLSGVHVCSNITSFDRGNQLLLFIGKLDDFVVGTDDMNCVNFIVISKKLGLAALQLWGAFCKR